MRRWGALGAAAAVVAIGVAVAVSATDPVHQLEAPDPGEVVAEWLPDETPVFVTRRGDEVAVLDARVPRWLDHGLEVYVGFCEEWLAAWEPYYFSTFDRAGEWTGGPAPGGLASYEAELAGDLVRVGPRRSPPPRPEGADKPARQSGPCSGIWADPDRVAQSRPPGVHHHQGGLNDAVAPERVAESSDADPALVLGAVERVDGATLRACAWEPSDVIEGPLCGEEALEVEEAPFGFLDSDFSTMYGSYGLYLMTSDDGRLRVEGVLPEQIEYHGEPRAGPAPPPGGDG